MSHFAIAGLQFAPQGPDAMAQIEAEVARAVRRFPWVRMVVLPELAAHGPALSHAEPLPGPTEQRFQALARSHGIWLVDGSIYEREGERIYNTASVCAPDGRVVARHRKLYPFLPYEVGVSAGTSVTVFDVPDVGRFGLSICYDGWFPEVARDMAWHGAEVMLLPSMTGTIDRAQELVLARAQAITNQCIVVNINIAGALGHGCSIVVGAEGQVLHQAGSAAELIPLDLDLQQVRRTRANGLLGLGQVLKSFRDGSAVFDCYSNPSTRPPSPHLQALGPIGMPGRGEAN
jgi:predicted amidohydrolase